MRLFIAVAADDLVKAAAAAVVRRLRRAPGDYRWVEPRDMHTTLRFLGEAPEGRLPEIRRLIERASAQTAPFELVYGGVEAFESLEDPRVVWIGLEKGLEPMENLAGRLGRDEPRPFLPHLTLGRRRCGPTPPEFLAALRGEPPLALRRSVDRLSLYASRPTPSGRAYEILFEAPLGA